jgi:uncharacterized protein DUF6191
VAILAFALPGGVLLLVLVGAYETHRRRTHPGRTLSETYVNEITALFYGTKRNELKQRDSWSMMREDEAQGAPPATGVDLDRGVVVLRPDAPDR